MHEIFDRSVVAAKESTADDDAGLDLMGAMVRNSGLVPSTKTIKPGTGLSESEVLGNSFVMFLAGHETAANSIHFACIYLALRPDIQRKLQAELDEIFGSTSVEAWEYETHVPKLFAGWAGAIMNEQLRLVPPVVNIPKSTSPTGPPQTVKVNGKDCVLAPNTFINLNSVSVHRNPKFWPAGPPRSEADGGVFHPCNPDNDLEEFKPERWFVLENVHDEGEGMVGNPDAETGVDLSSDTAATFFKPPKGACESFSGTTHLSITNFCHRYTL